MPRDTFLSGVVKIHIGCGGLVRFVEDIETLGVNFGFECQNCGTDIVEEDTIYLYEDALPDGITKHDIVEADETELARLEWHRRWTCFEDAVDGGLMDQVAEVVG